MCNPALPLACRSRLHCPAGLSHVYIVVATLHSLFHMDGDGLEDSWTRYCWDYSDSGTISLCAEAKSVNGSLVNLFNISNVTICYMKTCLELIVLEFWTNPAVIKTVCRLIELKCDVPSGGRRTRFVRNWKVWNHFRDFFPIKVNDLEVVPHIIWIRKTLPCSCI